MRNEKCLFAFLSIVLYLIARLSQMSTVILVELRWTF